MAAVTQEQPACRSMLIGVLRLVKAPFQVLCRSNKVRQLPAQEVLVPVKRPPQPEAGEDLNGSMPHRMVQFAQAASRETLHLGFHWLGRGRLSCLVLQLQSDGKPISCAWRGSCGNLDSSGVELRAPSDDSVGVQSTEILAADAEGKFTEQIAEMLHGGDVVLKLDQVPESTFAVAIALVASQDDQHLTSSSTLGRMTEVTLTMSQAGRKEPFWRHRQERGCEIANVLVSCCIYRGPHGGWRMEPMTVRVMMMQLEEASAEAASAAEAARVVAHQLRWLTKDRCWKSTSEERRLHSPGYCGA
eukprot:TRINITY_DN65421_c0_g1_i1.p1 TRINITY_DN65421_c0_g1~~TRINITY_DN65421_c0_g1_i1.p1  ORF type:complete len:302 (-),score=73.58 TRINITY_DN65421_c0_g1_i1:79-984(-)